MPTQWICVTISATSTCTVTASSTGAYNGVGTSEWLFVAGVIIFILSFILWPRIFRPLADIFDEK